MAQVVNQGAQRYDVVVVGGGAAGLSAALTVGRVGRRVLVVDDERPRNAPSAHMHGYLSRDGMAPGELLEVGRAELARYLVVVRTGRVASLARNGEGFAVDLADGQRVWARRVLGATGVVDQLPDVPGLADRWGREVVHCPYCHGWEVREGPVGVLLNSPMSVHQALMFRQLTDRLVALRVPGGPELPGEQLERLAAWRIPVVDGTVAGLEIADDTLTGVRMDTGVVVGVRAVAVGSRMVPRLGPLADLGLTVSAHPSGVADYVEADPFGRTSLPGVWVAGNLADPSANVIMAAASGARAATMINAELIEEDTARLLREARPAFHQDDESDMCTSVPGARAHGISS